MKKRRIFAGFAAAALAAAMMTVSAGAEATASGNNYSAGITGTTTTTFDKFLVMKKTAHVPNAEFGFTIAPGADQSGGADKLSVTAGVGTPAIRDDAASPNTGKAVFAPTDTTVNEDDATKDTRVVFNNTANNDEKYAVHTLTVDFTGVEFTEPGVYRYIITEATNENNTNYGITNDSVATRTLDVYVEDDGGSLKIAGYVMYSGTVTEAPNKTVGANKIESDVPNGAEAGEKSNSFTNAYATNDLSFGKKISGNQASKDKYFKFTLNITGAVAGTVYDVDLTHAFAGEIPTNVNTATTGKSDANGNPTTITVGDGGTATAEFWLQGDQYVTVKGLAQTTNYTVTEGDYSTEGYASTAVATATDATHFTISNVSFDDDTSGAIASADITTGFTNTKSGTIPTGVILSIAGPAVVGIAVVGGLIYFNVKRKKEDAEE